MNPVKLLGIGFCYARFRERRVRITRKKLDYSALSGVLALSVAIKMERFTMRKTIATVCAAVSIVLLAQLS